MVGNSRYLPVLCLTSFPVVCGHGDNTDLETGHITEMFMFKTVLGFEGSFPTCVVPIHKQETFF